jgi:ABC-type transporter Mla subunit MlaD
MASFVAAELIARLGADVSQFTRGMSRAADAAHKTSEAIEDTVRDVKNIEQASREAGQDIARGLGKADDAAKDVQHLGNVVRGADGKLRDLNTGKFVREMDAAGDAAQRAERRVKDASRGIGSLKSSLSSTGKAIGVGIAAASAAAVVFGKSANDAATESYKLGRQTEAIVKATGGAAGMTAKQIDDLAMSMSMKVGVDDEAIKKSMNILLTFRQVRNEAGKGNDIFNRASAAMMDLANVFGSSDAAAKMLGKALSDPVKGVTALQRAGVNFSQAQKDQIKALVQSGQTLEAQKLILAEVERQVGGTAEATATAGDKLKVVFGNFMEEVGGALLEVFNKVATVLVEKVLPALSAMWKEALPKIKDAFQKIRERVEPVVKALKERLEPVLKALSGWVKDNGDVVLAFFIALGAAAGIAAIVALGVAIAGLFNPVSLIIVGIAALVAGIVYAYKHSEKFREIVSKAFATVRRVWSTLQEAIADGKFNSTIEKIKKVLASLGELFKSVFGAIAAYVGFVIGVVIEMWDRFGSHLIKHFVTAWNAIFQVLSGVIQFFRGIFQIIQGIFTGDWAKIWEGVKNVFGGVWNVILGTLKYVVNLISTIIGAAMAFISMLWSDAWDAIKGVVGAVWDAIIGTIKWYIDQVYGIWSTLVTTITGIWSGLWNNLRAIVSGALDGIVSFLSGVKSRIATVASGMWDGIKDAFREAINFIIRGWNNLSLTVPKVEVFGKTIGGWSLDTPNIPLLAQGGIVTAPTLAMIGEAGPEAIVPLSNANRSNLGGDTIFNINVSVPATADQSRVGQAVVDALVAWQRRNGTVPIRTA